MRAFLAVFLFASSAVAQDVGRDEHEGQPCGARSDCGGVLKCIKQICTSKPAASATAEPEPEETTSDWSTFRLEGVHPFAGLVWAGAVVSNGLTGNRSAWAGADGGFLFALRGGLFIGRSELAIELSPVTELWDLRGSGPVFQVNGTYGYFIPIYEKGIVQLFWPLRVGVGISAGPNNNQSNPALAFFMVRGDVVGLALKIGHVMLDFMVPSFRYRVSDSRGTQYHILSWDFGMAAEYVF